MSVSPWLDNSPSYPVTTLTKDQLLDVWATHRNDLTGIMAAEELVRRLYIERELLNKQEKS